MENDNDQYSSNIRTNANKRKFEVLQAEILLISKFSNNLENSNLDNASISFEKDKILSFITSKVFPKRHLHLVENDVIQSPKKVELRLVD